MKGVVFTEFLDFVRLNHGEDTADDVIDDAAPPNGGAYTAVGSYPFAELVQLIGAYCQRSRTTLPAALEAFGKHLGGTFIAAYPHYFERCSGLFDLLADVEGHIHVDVRKLYPDAQLPTFAVHERTDSRMALDYASPRCLESLALGLIHRAADYYGQAVAVAMEAMRDRADPYVRMHIAMR